MPSPQDHATKRSDKGQVVIPADVRRLKGRLQAPAAPVSVEDMNLAIHDRRTRIALAPKRLGMQVPR